MEMVESSKPFRMVRAVVAMGRLLRDPTRLDEVFALAKSDAIFTGSSGAAAAWAAREIARKLPADALVVTLLPDSGERYLSKLNPEWMKEKGLLGADEGLS